MGEQELRQELDAAFKNRAVLYYLIFDELPQEVGEQRAKSILKRAIYRRGEQIGQQFRQFAPGNLSGLQEAFLAVIPDEGRLFDPRVVRCDEETLEIHLEALGQGQVPLRETIEALTSIGYRQTVVAEMMPWSPTLIQETAAAMNELMEHQPTT